MIRIAITAAQTPIWLDDGLIHVEATVLCA
jgi:hypothetical protein